MNIIIIFIRIYQKTLSPLLGPCCRYEPSCSNYAIQAVKIYGPWIGIKKALIRILKCHPFAAGGFDPVK